MFKFNNKTIIILSPQKWGKMHISKHHYAIELANRNNKVYFFNPPLKRTFSKIKIKKAGDVENLFIVNYSFFFLYNLRFHLRWLYNKLQKYQVKRIFKKISKPDVTWCFDTNIFSDLSIFKSKITIYHPVDNVEGEYQKELLDTSNFVFSVSDVIIDKLQKYRVNKKVYFVNHGLSAYFLNEQVLKENITNTKIKVFFVGNVLLNSLDREITKQIIKQNPNIQFVFIGAYTFSNISGNVNDEDEEFVMFLKKTKNIELKGSLHPEKIVQQIKQADVFLILINPQKDINKGSNSHKILEYLSTGKVIVANHISTYSDKRHLIEMVDEMHNDNLPTLFKNVISNLEYYNSPEMQKKRIEFALDNTYEKQIQRIENYINDNLNRI